MRDLGQLIIVHLVEKRSAGDVFPRKRADWPLHITLVPWFATNSDESGLLHALHAYCRETAAFIIQVGPEEKFGSGGDVPVNTIRNQAEIEQLHDALLKVVQEHGGAWEGEASARSGIGQKYRAHITHHVKDGVIHRRCIGDEEQVNDITVARLLSDNGVQKVEVLENITLGVDDEAAA